MVATSKVPMLKPENGNTAPKTIVVEGVEKVIPPTTTEEKAQKRLEVKARSILMMGILNEHQLKFNSIKGAKLLLEDVEKRFGLVTAQAINTANGVFAANTQVNAANIDKLSDAVICAFLASQLNNPQLAMRLQQIYPIIWKEMDLRWQMAMLTMRVRRFLKNTGKKLIINGNESVGFDKSKWSATTTTRRDILLKSVELQEIKTTRTRKSQEGAEEGPNISSTAYSSSSLTQRKSNDSPIIEDWVSDSEEENVSQTKTKKKTVKPSIAKIEFVKPKQQEKTARKTVKQVDCNYHDKQFQKQRMVKPVWNNAQRVNHQNFAKKTHPCAKKNMVPRAVLMKSGLVSVNTARQVNVAHTKTTVNAARPITMNYEPIVAGTQSNSFAGTKACDNADPKSSQDDGSKPSNDDGKKVDEDSRKDSECNNQDKEDNVNSTNNINATKQQM
ncbi:hypothetical protein Tco_1466379 [Tanacetum coccineum]